MTFSDATLNKRVRLRNEEPSGEGPVLYWMQRDQRVQDNWALIKAQKLALDRSVPLLVLFNIPQNHGKTTLRHYEFMIPGLEEIKKDLDTVGVTFWVTVGDPKKSVVQFVADHYIGDLVTDFNPLTFIDSWKVGVADQIAIKMWEVDAHNIIPCWEASDKLEYAAYTFRPRVHRKLSEYLVKIPKLQTHPYSYTTTPPSPDWQSIKQTVDQSVQRVEWLVPGPKEAKKQAKRFIAEKLQNYAGKRNDPNEQVLSNMSPYLRYGHISAQWLALEVSKSKIGKDNKDAYLEELIVRRELSDNFCFYNTAYDRVEGAHAWAQKTIVEHKADVREYVYSLDQFEEANTHDDLWNAMQIQMVTEGKMHGWCRMYWAKKILEWTPDIQTAIDVALYLNDKYELDGRDPNGFVGVMWSICGVHDRAWNERPVFGKVRYMNYSGAKRKFDIQSYIERYSGAPNLFHD